MSANKYQPHLLIVPEDGADEQIANGFVLHDQVKTNCVQVGRPAGGWPAVRDKFVRELIPYLESYHWAYVVLLVDFDHKKQALESGIERRRGAFDSVIPAELRDRVFVIGPEKDPEQLKQAIKQGYEQIGLSLAEYCYRGEVGLWDHELIRHNEAECERLIQSVKPFLFEA